MLNVLRYVPKHVTIMFTLAAAFMTTFSAFAAPEVMLDGNIAVANYSRGDTTWRADSVDASYDEVVRFKIYYHNTELPDSGLIAENLSIRVDMPTEAGSTQTVTANIRGDNTNTVVDTATVNLDRSDAYLELVSGSVEWRHNVGTRDNIEYETLNLADRVITDGEYIAIEHQKPCFEYEAWITFAARVRVPSVEIEKQVADQDEQEWSESVTSTPGDEVRFLLSARNNGNARVNSVTIRDILPEGMTYVTGSTQLFNTNHPDGITLTDDLFDSGINIGDLPNDTAGYITFRATIDDAESFECGMNTLTNRAQVVAIGFNGDEDTANVKVNRECEPEEPQYDCEALVTIIDRANREVNAEAEVTMSGDVTLDGVSIDFGDGTVVNNNDVNHTYSADGDYDIVATVSFNVSGEIKDVTCTDSVSFEAEVEYCEIPGKQNLPKNDPNCKEDKEFCEVPGKTHLEVDDPNCKEDPQTPPELPNTGAGSVIFTLFGATSAASAGYGFIRSRRLV